ncbi:MAG: hypothetical protein K2P18_06005 [Oscillospiraceae bacterium]|nr:hypothetical protein [Oscillospiraceae bacterium]
MGIKVIVLIFRPKPLKIMSFLTLLRKASPLTWQKAGPEAVLFCVSGILVMGLSLIYWLSLFYWGYRCNTENIPGRTNHSTARDIF